MFYGMCMKCGEKWALGDTPVCKCRTQRREIPRDDIINMAAQAGINEATWFYDDDVLEKFAALVVAAEREACAKLADEFFREGMDYDIGAAIRARK